MSVKTNIKDDNINCDIKVKIVKQTHDEQKDVQVFTYEEAINLAGSGRYGRGLLATLSLGILGMSIDMFGFSVIVTASDCEFHLTQKQKGIILSMPFMGPIVMAYAWGYISDTQGRRKSLLIALWVGFVLSCLSAFSPNWIVLAALRFLSTCFCSCSNSSSYTLLAESCSVKQKGPFMVIMTSILNMAFMTYIIVAYFILKLSFSIDLGFITFVPWRLLAIVLALPLGLSALCLHRYYESPKFLINIDEEQRALEYLRNIWKINGRIGGVYPVVKVELNEEGNVRNRDRPFLRSLWEQTVPLLKPPLLFRSLQLYYITCVLYLTTNGLFVWFPFVAKSFANGISSAADKNSTGLCNMITSTATAEVIPTEILCPTKIDESMLLAVICEGVYIVGLNLLLARLALWKKEVMITVMLISAASAASAVLVPNNTAALILYFGVITVVVSLGFLFYYFVELFPTSYRGMAACLGVMVARMSSVAAINLYGIYVISDCEMTFYVKSILLVSVAVVSCFLPSEKRNKKI